MKGSGTQESPYEITTCQELQEVMATDGAYGIVMNDLDCNKDGITEWNVSITTNTFFSEIDFQNHILNNVYIKSDGYFCRCSYSKVSTIKNASILNVYENGAEGFSSNVGFYNCAISIYGNSFKSNMFYYSDQSVYIDLCNIYIENTNSNKKVWFNVWGKGSDCSIKNSKLTLKGNIGNSDGVSLLFSRSGYNNSDFLVMKDCLIEGKLTGLNYASCALLDGIGHKSATTGCIYNIDLSENKFGKIGTNNSGTVNIVNKDLLPANTSLSDKYKLVSGEDILNPDVLTSLGFPVSEVI